LRFLHKNTRFAALQTSYSAPVMSEFGPNSGYVRIFSHKNQRLFAQFVAKTGQNEAFFATF
jgi:hypothetical protein